MNNLDHILKEAQKVFCVNEDEGSERGIAQSTQSSPQRKSGSVVETREVVPCLKKK